MENPYHPFDPNWHVVEANLRKKKYQEDMKKISNLIKSMRVKNRHLIMVTPKLRRPTKKICTHPMIISVIVKHWDGIWIEYRCCMCGTGIDMEKVKGK